MPVTNGVVVGALTSYALWSEGMRTSKRGALRAAEPIPYEPACRHPRPRLLRP